jgi:putative cardiolipin synthase
VRESIGTGAAVLTPTRLGHWIEPRVAASGGRSGFRLLDNGLDAFVARGALIELADQTLDLQYYIFHHDTTGSIVIDRLIAAAERGVRVRLLLDDWGTADKKDEAVAGLDAHPNIEVRLFNPYVNRSGIRWVAELLTSFARINRRMHNKQLIADGQAVVLGGRNIGDEYFGFGELEFQDVDVLGVGPVTEQSSASFDAYWNSAFATPISALGTYTITEAAFAAERKALHERVERYRDSPFAQALRESDLAQALRTQSVQLHWGDAKVLSDPPDKVTKPPDIPDESYLGAQLTTYAQPVRSELLVVSPYFVPAGRGLEFFGAKRRDGVRVRILTNSLAATDVWLVHAGYSKYRRQLLERGVEIYELKPEAQRAAGVKGLVGSSRASLHGKTFVLDRHSVFVGSLNIDPRSLQQNTEVGVIVKSAELARAVAALFERWGGPDWSYEVRLGNTARGRRLLWVGTDNGQPVQFTREPRAGFWRRFGARASAVLPIESLI